MIQRPLHRQPHPAEILLRWFLLLVAAVLLVVWLVGCATPRPQARSTAAPATRTLVAIVDPAPDATGYNLYHGTNLNRSTWSLIGTATTNVIPFTTPVPGFGFVGMKAYNAAGESDWACPASAPITPPVTNVQQPSTSN